jgi:hypothetical protein
MRSLFLKQQILISLLLVAAVVHLPSSHSRESARSAALSQECSQGLSPGAQ